MSDSRYGEAAGTEERTAEVGGRQATFLRHEASGPTFVLLHGAGGNHRAWWPLVEQLEGVDLLVPSLPGRCGSDGPPCATAAEAGAWVVELLGALGIERAVVAGHSYGGAVALESALASQPRPVAGLVLMATGAKLRVHPTILDIVEQAAERGEPADTGRVAWHPDTPDELVERVEGVRRETPPTTTLVDWRASNAFDRMASLLGVGVPALVIAGSEDALTPPKYAEYLEAHLPDARLLMLEGAGHMLPMERRREVAAALVAFLHEVGG